MRLFWDTPMTRAGYRAMREEVTRRRGDGWWFPFGKSILGRTLWCLTLGSGSPRVLYVAGHHAMEWLTGNLLLAFAAGEERLPQGTLYFVPCLNPDGAELQIRGTTPSCLLAERQRAMNGGAPDFRHWQANARGVDLNHNYPAGFEEYRAVERELGILGGAPTRYRGEYPLSEPESAAMLSLISMLAPDGVLSLHTQGRELFFGAGAPRTTHLWAEILGRRVGYRAGHPTGAAAYGGLSDTLAEMGIPAVTVEVGLGENPLPQASLPALYREVLPLLRHAPDCLEFVNKL